MKKISKDMQRRINYMRRMYEDVPFIGGEPEKRLTDEEWYYIIKKSDGTEQTFELTDED